MDIDVVIISPSTSGHQAISSTTVSTLKELPSWSFLVYSAWYNKRRRKKCEEESSLPVNSFVVGSLWWDYSVHQIISRTGRVKRWMEKSSSSHSSQRPFQLSFSLSLSLCLCVRRYLQVDDYRWCPVSRSIRHWDPLGGWGSSSFSLIRSLVHSFAFLFNPRKRFHSTTWTLLYIVDTLNPLRTAHIFIDTYILAVGKE